MAVEKLIDAVVANHAGAIGAKGMLMRGSSDADYQAAEDAFLASVAALRTELAREGDEIQRLRKAIELLYPDASEDQDDLVRLGVLVRVPPNERERAEWDLDVDDDWFVFAWSERAARGGQDGE